MGGEEEKLGTRAVEWDGDGRMAQRQMGREGGREGVREGGGG
jgi:hypothetical protein